MDTIKPEVTEAEESGYPELRHLTDTYAAVQKLRIANSNRVSAHEREVDETEPDPFVASLVDRLEGIEGDISKQMGRIVKDHPAWPWLTAVKGMGPVLSAKILGLINDIEKFSTASKLWKYSGYGLSVLEHTPYYLPHEFPEDVEPIEYTVGMFVTPPDANNHRYEIVEILSAVNRPLDTWPVERDGHTFQDGHYFLAWVGSQDEYATDDHLEPQSPGAHWVGQIVKGLDDNVYEVVEILTPVEREEWPTHYGVEFVVGYVKVREAGGLHDIQRPKKGEKLSYNRRLKTAVYLAGESFIRSRSPFRKLYDEAKIRYRYRKQVLPIKRILEVDAADQPDRTTVSGKKEWDKLISQANKEVGAKRDEACWTDLHVEHASRRYMVKIFLSLLWQVWREAEGLQTRKPYPVEYLDHDKVFDPWEFADQAKVK